MNLLAKLILLTLALTSFALTGCATVPKGSAELQRQSESMLPPDGKAGVYVFRPHMIFFAGEAVLLKIELDSKLFGYLAPESYLYGIVTPGEHSVGLGYPEVNPIKFTAKSGNNYYFKESLGFPGAKLVKIENDEARRLIGEFTLSGHNVFEKKSNRLDAVNATHGKQNCICITRTSKWHTEGGKVTVSLTAQTEGEKVTGSEVCTLLLNENNELKIIRSNGEILMLSGRVMLVKGVPLEKGYEIDSADIPMLHYLLVTGLLNLAYPDGPANVVSEHNVVHSEQEKSLIASTGSARTIIQPPWKASVRAVRADPHSIAYEIALKKDKTEFTYEGLWKDMNSRLVLDDSMNISEWRTYSIGIFSRSPGHLDPPNNGGRMTIIDYGAYPHKFEAQTIGDLRAFIKQKE